MCEVDPKSYLWLLVYLACSWGWMYQVGLKRKQSVPQTNKETWKWPSSLQINGPHFTVDKTQCVQCSWDNFNGVLEGGLVFLGLQNALTMHTRVVHQRDHTLSL